EPFALPLQVFLRFFLSRRQTLHKRQLGSRMQLTKVYLIHERADEEDSTPCAAQQILWGQRIGQGCGINALAFVGNNEDQSRAGVFKADVDLFGRVVIVAMEYGVHS